MKTKTMQLGSNKTIVGKNINKKLVPFARKHPESAEAHFLSTIQTGMAEAGIDGKLTSIEIDFDEKPYSTETIDNNCVNCGRGIKYMRKVDLHINGKPVNFGKTGNNMGEDCFDITTGLCEALKQGNYKPRIMDEKKQRAEIEKTAKVKISLDQLAKKAANSIQEAGISLDSKIKASIADDVQEQIIRGDLSGLKRELDPGKSADVLGWLIANSRTIYDKQVRKTTALLATQPELVSQEDLHDAVLYEWQERLWGTSGELGGIKEDLHYLAELSKTNPAHKVIRKYGKTDLDTTLTPIKAFNRARWEDITLRTILGDTEQEASKKKKSEINHGRTAATKAQARAVKYAVPYLRERRIYHNRQAMNALASPEEFSRLLENVEKRYNREKAEYAAQKARGVEKPIGYWESNYKKIAPFFSLKEEIHKTKAKPNNRQVLLSYVFMQDAEKTARQLFVEGKKIDLAVEKGNHIAEESYAPLADVKAEVKDFDSKLEKLLNSAIEFENTPSRTGRRIRKAGMAKETLRHIVESIRETYQFGIVEAQYAQRKGTMPSALARALEMAADYEKIDAETQQKLGKLQALAAHPAIQLKFKNVKNNKFYGGIKAENGDWTKGEKAPVFDLKAYEGRKYINAEQKKTINRVYMLCPAKDADLEKVSEDYSKLTDFYKNKKVYTSEYYKITFERVTGVPSEGRHFQFRSPKALEEELGEIAKLEAGEKSRYNRVTDELKQQLSVLRTERAMKYAISWANTTVFPENLDEILADTRTIFTDRLVEAINNKYDSFIRNEEAVRKNREELSKKGYDLPKIVEQLTALQGKGIALEIPDDQAYNYKYTATRALERLQDDFMIIPEGFVRNVAGALKRYQPNVSQGI
jgi:hypothetical protein